MQNNESTEKPSFLAEVARVSRTEEDVVKERENIYKKGIRGAGEYIVSVIKNEIKSKAEAGQYTKQNGKNIIKFGYDLSSKRIRIEDYLPYGWEKRIKSAGLSSPFADGFCPYFKAVFYVDHNTEYYKSGRIFKTRERRDSYYFKGVSKETEDVINSVIELAKADGIIIKRFYLYDSYCSKELDKGQRIFEHGYYEGDELVCKTYSFSKLMLDIRFEY